MVAGSDGEGLTSTDKWALWYVNVNYIRSILEAFDEDVSGFVTVKEANDFTRSRPLDWRWVLGNPFQAQRTHMNQSSALVSILGHW